MRKLKALLLCILAAVTVASTVCAFAAETEPAPLQVVSVSPIVYSDNTDAGGKRSHRRDRHTFQPIAGR